MSMKEPPDDVEALPQVTDRQWIYQVVSRFTRDEAARLIKLSRATEPQKPKEDDDGP